jgi:uncharacterized protein DUF6492
MDPIVLHCCTYARDVLRAKRLLESVALHNKEAIACYVSVPRRDLELFRTHLPAGVAELLCEEDTLAANPALSVARFHALPGGRQQQIIKSEFWRLGLAENYLALDADCVFIRDFGRADFLAEANVPYSVVHEGRNLLQATARFGPQRARGEFTVDRTNIMREMGREGVVYDYGYAPFLWSRRVWQDLDRKFMAPQGKTLIDLIAMHPSEFTWYGEALMKFRAIPLWPREELFRHYHYEHQYWLDRMLGMTPKILARDYLGVVYQSNWETWTEYGPSRKSLPSRVARSLKRVAKKMQFLSRAR